MLLYYCWKLHLEKVVKKHFLSESFINYAVNYSFTEILKLKNVVRMFSEAVYILFFYIEK